MRRRRAKYNRRGQRSQLGWMVSLIVLAGLAAGLAYAAFTLTAGG